MRDPNKPRFAPASAGGLGRGIIREEDMKIAASWIGKTALLIPAFISSSALAQTEIVNQEEVAKVGGIPQFMVDPFWPKPLPNNWLLGQVSGIRVDRFDHIWVVQRPGSLDKRELAARQNPPQAKCCAAAPPVLVFDQFGNLIRHWGGPGPGYNWPKSEHSVYIDDNDFIWLAGNDKNDGQILKFTMDGSFVMQIGKPINGPDSNATDHLGSP